MKLRKTIVVIGAVVAVTTAPAAWAQCGGHSEAKSSCCPTDTRAKPGVESHDHCAGHGSQSSGPQPTHTTARKPLAQPTQLVFHHYLAIQTALAQDTWDETTAGSAATIVKTLQSNAKLPFSPQLVQHAEALTKAEDLKSAREQFKALSLSLIQYLADKKMPPGGLRQAYCPMAKAGWLQMGTELQNPYMGQEMLQCGQFKS